MVQMKKIEELLNRPKYIRAPRAAKYPDLLINNFNSLQIITLAASLALPSSNSKSPPHINYKQITIHPHGHGSL
jgi:hypothetical protein